LFLFGVHALQGRECVKHSNRTTRKQSINAHMRQHLCGMHS
jgi:hypothetical protein